MREIVRGDKHNPRKSASANQYNVRSEWHWFVRCNLQIFSGCVCHLEQLHAQSPFLFPIVFSINTFSQEYLCTLGFQKDQFSKRSVLGCPHVSYVNTETPFTRMWIDPRKRASTWKSRPLCSTCMLKKTDSPRAQIALFLFVSFACQCRFSVLRHVLVPQGRSVRIVEAGDKRKAPKAKWNTNKRRGKMKQTNKKTPDLRLSRRRGRVASEDNSNHPPFCSRRQLPSKKKMSCYWFRQRDCTCTWSNIYRVGKPFLIALETVAEKIRIPCSHAEKIRIRNLHFRKNHFRERFRKAPFSGPSVFKKLRIRADTCDRFYVHASGVEKLRFRKDPGIRVHVASLFVRRCKIVGRSGPVDRVC